MLKWLEKLAWKIEASPYDIPLDELLRFKLEDAQKRIKLLEFQLKYTKRNSDNRQKVLDYTALQLERYFAGDCQDDNILVDIFEKIEKHSKLLTQEANQKNEN